MLSYLLRRLPGVPSREHPVSPCTVHQASRPVRIPFYRALFAQRTVPFAHRFVVRCLPGILIPSAALCAPCLAFPLLLFVSCPSCIVCPTFAFLSSPLLLRRASLVQRFSHPPRYSFRSAFDFHALDAFPFLLPGTSVHLCSLAVWWANRHTRLRYNPFVLCLRM